MNDDAIPPIAPNRTEDFIAGQEYRFRNDIFEWKYGTLVNIQKIQETQIARTVAQSLGTTQADVAGAGFTESGSALALIRSSAQQGALAALLRPFATLLPCGWVNFSRVELREDDKAIPVSKAFNGLKASDTEIKYWLHQKTFTPLQHYAHSNDRIYYMRHYTGGNIHEIYCSLREVQAKTDNLPRLMRYQDVMKSWEKHGSEETLKDILAAAIRNSKCKPINQNGEHPPRPHNPPYEDSFFILSEIEAVTNEYFGTISDATIEKLFGDFVYSHTRDGRPKEEREETLEAYNQQASPEHKIFSIGSPIFRELYPKKKNPDWRVGRPRKKHLAK